MKRTSQLFETEEITDDKHSSNQLNLLVNGLQNDRIACQFTDVILCVDHEEFHCHRAVLASSSPYFHAMFSRPFQENSTKRIIINSVSPWAFRRILDFAYTGRLELTVSTVQDVFIAASLFIYHEAMEACIAFMLRHIDVHNCLGLMTFAEHHRLDALFSAAEKFCIENFDLVVRQSPEWCGLTHAKLVDLLKRNEINVKEERMLLLGVVDWISSDIDGRICVFPSLLRHIRLAHINDEQIQRDIDKIPVFRDCKSARDLVLDHLKRNSGNRDARSPRPSTLKHGSLVVFGGMDSEVLTSMEYLALNERTWHPCSPMPVNELTWFAASVLNKNIILTGGVRAGIIQSVMWRYNSELDQWTKKSSMPRPRARHTSFTVDGNFLILLGGITMEQSADGQAQTCFVESIDCYDMRLDEWQVVGHCERPRQESSAALLPASSRISTDIATGERTVIELGGFTETDQSEQARGLDQITLYRLTENLRMHPADQFIKLPHPVRYGHCTLRAEAGLAYLFFGASSELCVLDASRNSLRQLASLADPQGNAIARVHAGVAWVDEFLYVTGGFPRSPDRQRHREGARSEVFRYDPEKDAWQPVSIRGTTTPRAIFGCVCLDM